jgi:transcription-repair coupling factor (superfamily II helicase)
MEAYRRLGAVATPDDVDDVRDEWEDRYGPPPPPAEALLAAARLRAECVRLGVSSITVSGGAARVRGLDLPASKQARLERLAPGARFGSGEALVPLKVAPTEVAAALTALLRELVPPVASAAP